MKCTDFYHAILNNYDQVKQFYAVATHLFNFLSSEVNKRDQFYISEVLGLC